MYIIKCWNILPYYDVDMKCVNWKRHSDETYYQKMCIQQWLPYIYVYIYNIYIYNKYM